MDVIEERVIRLESVEAIRQLAARHALALDQRDLAALAALYVEPPDLEPMLSASAVSFHLTGAHVIDLVDPGRARGTVQCRAEHQAGSRWWVIPMLYFDEYERHERGWLLRSRSAHAFRASPLAGEATEQEAADLLARLGMAPDLPERWTTWRDRWHRA